MIPRLPDDVNLVVTQRRSVDESPGQRRIDALALAVQLHQTHFRDDQEKIGAVVVKTAEKFHSFLESDQG